MRTIRFQLFSIAVCSAVLLSGCTTAPLNEFSGIALGRGPLPSAASISILAVGIEGRDCGINPSYELAVSDAVHHVHGANAVVNADLVIDFRFPALCTFVRGDAAQIRLDKPSRSFFSALLVVRRSFAATST